MAKKKSTKKKAIGTPPTQMRLLPKTLEQLDALAAHHGLSSRTEVVRFLANAAFLAIEAKK